MHWQRRTGAVLMVFGALLLGFYLVPTVYGKAMAHIAVAQFRLQSHTNSLWDSARVRAYQQTLGVTMAPEAFLRVPKAGIEVPVYEGTSDLVLNRGVGHIPGTAMPGQSGNISITGHRDGFFRGLKDVAPGDIVEVQHPASGGNNASRTDRYIIQRTFVVFPQDTSVLNSTDRSTLTLVTCYPFYYVGAAPQRFIVQAALLPSGS